MFRFLEKLRKKTESEKNTIAFGVSVSVTGIIFIVWASYMYVQFSESIASSKLPDISSPVAAIKESFSETFNQNKLKSLDEVFSFPKIDEEILDQATSSSTDGVYVESTSTDLSASSTENQ